MPFGWGSSASATAAPPRASAYKPTYVVPYRTPRDNVEAQALYNHIRTAALALDSLSRSIPLPFLQNLPPALDIGIESIIGFIAPVIGDAVGLVMGLYIVFCCFLFGNLSTYILGQMLLNVIIDAVIGIVPFIGDVLDVAFKSNVRNLRLLESHLSKSQKKGGFVVELAPSYEEEFANAPPPRAGAGGGLGAALGGGRGGAGAQSGGGLGGMLGGLDWRTLAQLASMFSIGGGRPASRR